MSSWVDNISTGTSCYVKNFSDKNGWIKGATIVDYCISEDGLLFIDDENNRWEEAKPVNWWDDIGAGIWCKVKDNAIDNWVIDILVVDCINGTFIASNGVSWAFAQPVNWWDDIGSGVYCTVDGNVNRTIIKYENGMFIDKSGNRWPHATPALDLYLAEDEEAEQIEAAEAAGDYVPDTRPDAPAILQEAIFVMEQRAKERDVNKERSMESTVKAFNALFGTDMSVREGWIFMAMLKFSRSRGNDTLDHFVDAAAYVALAGETRD